MGFATRVLGFGIRNSGFGFRNSGIGFRDSQLGFRVSGLASSIVWFQEPGYKTLLSKFNDSFRHPLDAKKGVVIKPGFIIQVPRDLPCSGIWSRVSHTSRTRVPKRPRDSYKLNHRTFKKRTFLAPSGCSPETTRRKEVVREPDFGFRDSGSDIRDSRIRVSVSGFRGSDLTPVSPKYAPGCSVPYTYLPRPSAPTFGVSGFGFRVLGFGCRVSGFGFQVSGFGFPGLGFPGSGYPVSSLGCE